MGIKCETNKCGKIFICTFLKYILADQQAFQSPKLKASLKFLFPVIPSVVLPRQTGEARGCIEGVHYAHEKVLGRCFDFASLHPT